MKCLKMKKFSPMVLYYISMKMAAIFNFVWVCNITGASLASQFLSLSYRREVG